MIWPRYLASWELFTIKTLTPSSRFVFEKTPKRSLFQNHNRYRVFRSHIWKLMIWPRYLASWEQFTIQTLTPSSRFLFENEGTNAKHVLIIPKPHFGTYRASSSTVHSAKLSNMASCKRQTPRRNKLRARAL